MHIEIAPQHLICKGRKRATPETFGAGEIPGRWQTCVLVTQLGEINRVTFALR